LRLGHPAEPVWRGLDPSQVNLLAPNPGDPPPSTVAEQVHMRDRQRLRVWLGLDEVDAIQDGIPHLAM